MLLEEPASYGRIVRNSAGEVSGIVEAKDATGHERDIQEVNTGIYCAGAALLQGVIPGISNANAQGEYYLTDMVRLALERGWKVQAVAGSDPTEFMGVNTKEELQEAARVIAQRL
jgi:bifunctional UDP-N-acetylglucosamine pyrophosphorylase/glucosamine-1-phosphate N-acetyltransferase